MFSPTDPNLFFSKNDPLDLRLGDLVFKQSKSQKSFSIIGYPDDEGIKLNGGRTGAASAPDSIRKILYKMTPPPQYISDLPSIVDLGNGFPANLTLDERHSVALAFLKTIDKKECLISFGGGHDYGYVDGAAFCEKYISDEVSPKPLNKPLIINFDAHLDVRPPVRGNNSGTSFFRLKEKFKDQFNLIELGLQPQCNSRSHWDWAQKNNIELITLESLEASGWDSIWNSHTLKNLTIETPVFVSFDIDALRNADAGGCSQAWPIGLKISECMLFLKKLYARADVRSLGIYEVSPPLDTDFKTSKAAALLTHQFIFSEGGFF